MIIYGRKSLPPAAPGKTSSCQDIQQIKRYLEWEDNTPQTFSQILFPKILTARDSPAPEQCLFHYSTGNILEAGAIVSAIRLKPSCRLPGQWWVLTSPKYALCHGRAGFIWDTP